MYNLNKKKFLNAHPLFDQLPSNVRTLLIEQFDWSILKKGTTLIEEGSASHLLAIVHTGCLTVYKSGRLLGYINEGEIIGEISLIGKQNITATLIAERDTLLLQVSKSCISELMYQHIDLALQLAQLSVNRATGYTTKKQQHKLAHNLTLMSLGLDIEWQDAFATNLSSQLNDVLILTSQMMEKQLDFELQNELSEQQQITLYLAFGELQRQYSQLLLIADQKVTFWNEMLLRQANQIMLLIDKKRSPAITPVEAAIWEKEGFASKVRVDLIIYNEKSSDNQENSTFEWLVSRNITNFLEINSCSKDALKPVLKLIGQQPAIIQRLAKQPLFADIEPANLHCIASYFNERNILAGTLLCSEGSQSDALFLVDSGILTAFSGTQVFSEIFPGEVIGEVGILLDCPRSASVRAERDAIVLELSRTNFKQLITQIPELYQRLSTMIAKRLTGGTKEKKKQQGINIALISILDQAEHFHYFEQLAEQLALSLNKLAGCKAISSSQVNQELGANVAQLSTEVPSSALIIEWLSHYEEVTPFMLLIGDSTATEWSKRILRQADRVILVSHYQSSPQLSDIEQQLKTLIFERHVKPELVILQAPEATQGKGTIQWLNNRCLKNHHHIRIGSESDCDRVARMLTGHAFGLVLSGISTRAIAHVGVIRALSEKNIPIDCLSGSSSGAGIAGAVALGRGWQSVRDIAHNITLNISPKMGHFTLPYTALTTGDKTRDVLLHNYGTNTLEDQFIRCIPLAADIRHSKLVEIKQGFIWLAVRASGSLPVIWPPVIEEDQVLVDSGLINNVPTEALEKYCQHGWTLVSDPNADFLPFEGIKKYGSVVSGWKVLWHKLLGKNKAEGYYPSLLEIIGHAMCIGSYAKAHSTKYDEFKRTIVFDTVIPSQGFFSVNSTSKMIEIENITYTNALKIIEKYPELNIMPSVNSHQKK